MSQSEAIQPVVDALSMASANTEYSWAVPENVVGLSIQCRDATDIRVAFTSGKVAGSTDPYITIKAGTALTLPEKTLLKTGLTPTIYMATGSASKVAEIIYHKRV